MDIKIALPCAAGEKEDEMIRLTDEPETARRLHGAGECVLFLLTKENEKADIGGIDWCVQVPADRSRERETAWEKDAVLLYDHLPAAWRRWLPEAFLHRVWQRSRGLPWHILDTRRLRLRELTEEDAAFVQEICAQNTSVRLWTEAPGDGETPERMLRQYIHSMYGFFGYGIWAVERKEEVESCPGRLVGLAGLQNRAGFASPELGFCIAAPYRGRGYAREACLAVLRYGFEELELPEIRAVVHRENKASLHLCETLGFLPDKAAADPEKDCLGLRLLCPGVSP